MKEHLTGHPEVKKNGWTDDPPESDPDHNHLSEEEDTIPDAEDTVFHEIQARLARESSRKISVISMSTTMSEALVGEEIEAKTADNFVSLPYGFVPRATYEHHKKNPDIMGVVYNGRIKKYVILDCKGISTWVKNTTENHVSRDLTYPSYEYRNISQIVYAKKYNVYFALNKDFTLKVLNKNFEETCRVSSDLRSVLFMVFNPARDELITGGVGGIKIWTYQQIDDKSLKIEKPMSNWRLKLKFVLDNVGGNWVKRVDLNLEQQHIYCCSDTDLNAYTMDGKMLFKLERAHLMSITGCVYSSTARMLVTSSVDTMLKVWSVPGGLLHTFRGHSRAITQVLCHPDSPSLILTSSLDGSVRMWSLDTMDCVYNLTVSADGVLWMGITEERLLYLGTLRSLTVWSLNTTARFWAMARGRLKQLTRVHGKGKSTRILALGYEGSVRLFSRRSQKNLCTVLPPPPISPMGPGLLGAAYNRVVSVVYMLLDSRLLWVYTTRTDPACRAAVWDVLDLQEQCMRQATLEAQRAGTTVGPRASALFNQKGPSHRATEHGSGSEPISACSSVCYLEAQVIMYTDEGPVCPIQHNYLLLGLEDGRILFMDPVVRGKKYFEFKANKDKILLMEHDRASHTLMTQCHLGERTFIQLWSLPELELVHQVLTPKDVVGFIRINMNIMTGHESGAVLCHPLLPLEETVTANGKPKMAIPESPSSARKPEHKHPILAIDVCSNLGIFITASGDGVIKVWQDGKILLTEIQLDDSLTTACFLNNRGDILVGFQNHVFVIDHTKVCSTLEVPEEREEDMETESQIYEDPAVKYEGIGADPDAIDMESYLVPFELDFSEDFLSGKKLLEDVEGEGDKDGETEGEKDTHTDEESELSAAPTSMYISPMDTPRKLSMLDLTLGAEATNLDLKHSYKQRYSPDEEVESVTSGIELPKFGISPGPSPSPSTPSVATPSSINVSEGGDSTPHASDLEEDGTFKPIQVNVGDLPMPEVLAPKPVKTTGVSVFSAGRPSMKERLGAIKIDAASLMKTKKVRSTTTSSAARKEADHSHVRGAEEAGAIPGKTAAPKRSGATGERRRPKRGVRKAGQQQQDEDDEEEGTRGKKPVRPARGRAKRVPVRPLRPGQPPPVPPTAVSATRDSSSSDPDDPRRKFQVPPTSDLNIEARKVGAGAAPGVLPGGRGGVPGRPRYPMDGLPLGPDGLPVGGVVGVDGVVIHAGAEGIEAGGAWTLPQEYMDQDWALHGTLQGVHQTDMPEGQYPPSNLLVPPVPLHLRRALLSHPHETPPGTLSSEGEATEARAGSSSLDNESLSSAVQYAKRHGLDDLDPSNDDNSSIHLDLELAALEDEIDESSDMRGKSILKSPSFSLYSPRISTSSRGKDGIVGADGRVASAQKSVTIDVPEDYQEHDGKGGGRPDSRSSFGRRSKSPLDRAKSPFDRSLSPGTVISDYGSEWTVPAPEEMQDILADMSEHRRRQYIKDVVSDMTDHKRREYIRELARSGIYGGSASATYHRRPHTGGADSSLPWRPHTAIDLPAGEKLEEEFQRTLVNYKGIPGTPEYIDHLYKKDSNKFGETYHDKILERHYLLRMQKQLRSQSAQERRQNLEQRRMEKRHAGDNVKAQTSRSDTALHQLYLRNQQHQQSSPYPQSRAQSAGAAMRGPSPWTNKDKMAAGGQSASLGPETWTGSLAPDSWAQGSEFKGTLRPRSTRPQTAMTQRTGVSEVTSRRSDKSELSAERAFRGRINPEKSSKGASSESTGTKIDIKILDPRHPASRAYRPVSSSIPSKCSRYVLISHGNSKGGGLLPPTPLEERLIPERFPEFEGRWLGPGHPISPQQRLNMPTFEGMNYSPVPVLH